MILFYKLNCNPEIKNNTKNNKNEYIDSGYSWVYSGVSTECTEEPCVR